MFGIGGRELVFIILVILMLFGSDKIPEMARTLGKIVSQVKNATNDIKSEIQKSVGDDIDTKEITRTFTERIEKVKQEITAPIEEIAEDVSVTKDIEEVKEDIESMTGPIKRQR